MLPLKGTIILSLLLLLFPGETIQFRKFTQLVPASWEYKIEKNILTIWKRDSVEIFYCGLNPLMREPVEKEPYIITIEALRRFPAAEVQRRRLMQDSLLADYKRKYDERRDMFSYGQYHYFMENRNTIDSLRIPFYNDNRYSYFYKDNISGSFCFLHDSVGKEVQDFNEVLYSLK